ncbi:MAG: GIY-YIG nuclease family protein [Niabella sp.]
MDVGSAHGDEMHLTRWQDYVKKGHGENKELKELDFNHIQKRFRYSILDILKPTTDNDTIKKRESWWKEVLLSRKIGYNKN